MWTARWWRRGLMQVLLLALVAGAVFAAAPVARADGPQPNHTTVCSASHNACETVVNAIKGSDYIMWVRVWDEHSSASHTMRVLFDGYPRASATWDVQYPGAIFLFYYTTRRGMCIQGGVEGVPDGRTPCWYAP